MELEGFTVRGFRSLADTAEIPVGRPTILTGANDGGKSAALQALRILLDGTPPTAEDYTFDSTGDEPQTPNDQQPRRRMDTCTVAGRFTLSPAEQAELKLPGPEVAVRRVVSPGSTPRCQVRLTVPTNPDLRGLDNSLLVTELRERASRLGLQPQGPANQRQSYLVPLQALARSAPTSEAWVVTPRAILEHLPRVLMFSSAKEPDPAAEIREALRATYDKLLDDKTLIEPVRTVEEKIQGRLEDEAQDLCKHIRLRCPELSEIKVDPSVSFKDGFRSLTVSTGHEDGQAVPLDISGTGRRRRISLAVWEWTQKLATFAEDGSRALVIAYDEPDTHLDYTRQRELVDLIRTQAGTPGVRVVVATHSLNLIDKVEISDVVHLTLDQGHTTVHRLVSTDHHHTDRYLSDIAASMGLRNSVLLHERCFLVVEGATELQAIPILFRLVTGMSLQAAGVALLAGNGNWGVLKVAEFLNANDRRVHFLLDADSNTDQACRKLLQPARLRQIGIAESQLHLVGDPDEIEDLFSDAQWTQTANQSWHRDDQQPWTITDLRACRDDANVKFSEQLRRLIRRNTHDAPANKHGYLVELAHQLHQPDQVPGPLRELFNDLIDLADYP